MKTKLAVAVALITLGTVGWNISHPRTVELAVPHAPPSLAKFVEGGGSAKHEIVPADIDGAQRRLRESSELLEKQLMPLVQQMPGEIKRLKAMIADNERLMKNLGEMDPKLLEAPKN